MIPFLWIKLHLDSEYQIITRLEMTKYFGFGFETESKASFGLGFVAKSKASFGFGFDSKPK